MAAVKIPPTLLFLSVFCLVPALRAEWIEPAASTMTVPASDTPAPESGQSAPAPAVSEFPPIPQADRVRAFISLEGFHRSFGGDFNGDTFVVASDNSQAILVPKIKGGNGLAGKLGVRRFSDRAVDIGADVGFSVSSHRGEQMPWSGDVALLTFDGNLSVYFNSVSRALTPYLTAGLTLPFLNIDNGAFTPGGREQSALYTGFGFNAGAGLEWTMGEHWALQGGVLFKWMEFTNVNGIDAKRLELDDGLALSGVSPRLGLMYFF